jgi:asparaginyl-tRNA synthetase
MSIVSVASALRGGSQIGQQLSVRGWVRSKRDSKAGISFVAIHDGSCFDTIQAVRRSGQGMTLMACWLHVEKL